MKDLLIELLGVLGHGFHVIEVILLPFYRLIDDVCYIISN
jgi:hypothetical protein